MSPDFLDGDAWRDMFAAWPWTLPVLAGTVGACFASFAGVVADRLPHSSGHLGADGLPGRSLWSRSVCDGCGTVLGAVVLVPVAGWFACRGRCPSCGTRVPVVYPVVEAATAVLSASVAACCGATTECLWILVAMWALLAASWTDMMVEWLPDRILMPMLLCGLLWSPFEPDALVRNQGMAAASVGMWAMMWLIGRLRGVEAMAGGDVFLAAVGGAWVGLQAFPAFYFLAGVLYSVHAFISPLLGGRSPRNEDGGLFFPMGPAISVALVLVLLLGAHARVD